MGPNEVKAQHYKMKANPDHMENARSGQFLFEDDDSTDACGFVDFLSDCEIAFMFFEPVDVPEGAIVIQEECSWLDRLKEILDEDPEMEKLWMGIVDAE